MSDQQEKQAATSATPGELLRQERELQGRTVQQVAGDLHIGAYMVEAIENNQFAVLGAPVFARGHLRKYAALLGLSVERVQALYQNLSDRPRDQDPVPVMHRNTEPSIPMSPDSKQRRTLQKPGRWTFLIAGGALVVAGIVAWLIHEHSKSANKASVPIAEAPATSDAVIQNGPVPVLPAVQTTVQGTTTTNAVTTANKSTTERQAITPAVASAPTPVTRGKVRLRFSFTQESWVEVYDARGTRLLYDVGFPGQTRGVDVDPPAQIVLGQAASVSTEVNGRAISVPARRIANQVARFTVGADGVAQ
jgi:cytoskeleton protein RodZ